MELPKSQKNSHQYLTSHICEKFGLLPLSHDGPELLIGAMNPVMPDVLKLTEKIERETQRKVIIKQIDSGTWEKWLENISEERSNLSIKLAESSSPSTQKDEIAKLEKSKEANDSNIKIVKENLQVEEVKDIDTQTNEQNYLNASSNELEFSEADQADSLDGSSQDGAEGDRDLASSDDVVKAVANILLSSDKLKASDIHIEPQQSELRVRYRVDGILEKVYSIPKSKASGIIARTKILSKLDVAEKRLPQDGRLRAKFNDEFLDFRVSTLPGKYGEKIVLRALRSDNSILDLKKLISEKSELSLVRELCDTPYGIFIVVGPTGSGKSTTLYSILSEHNEEGINISTVEDPIEYTLPGLHQVQVVREKGFDFARALRALMRQDPDVILVGETRDKETAQVAMEAALTGHMVFTTLHANDTSTAVSRLAEMGVAPYLISSSVVGVLAQRLMRRVCPQCSIEVIADPDNVLLSKHKIDKYRKAEVRIGGMHKHEKSICPLCKGSGYTGRIGVYEVLKIDDKIRHSILSNYSADQIREVSRSQGMRTMLEYGMSLVKQSLTTIEEVERVCVLESDD